MRIEPLRRARPVLRLAPLVDVVFLLLVFFMLVSRLETPLAIALAPADEGRQAMTGAVLVRLGADGRLDLNGVPVGLTELADEVAPLLASEPTPRVLVQPSPEAPLEGLVRVLDVLAAAGVAKPSVVAP